MESRITRILSSLLASTSGYALQPADSPPAPRPPAKDELRIPLPNRGAQPQPEARPSQETTDPTSERDLQPAAQESSLEDRTLARFAGTWRVEVTLNPVYFDDAARPDSGRLPKGSNPVRAEDDVHHLTGRAHGKLLLNGKAVEQVISIEGTNLPDSNRAGDAPSAFDSIILLSYAQATRNFSLVSVDARGHGPVQIQGTLNSQTGRLVFGDPIEASTDRTIKDFPTDGRTNPRLDGRSGGPIESQHAAESNDADSPNPNAGSGGTSDSAIGRDERDSRRPSGTSNSRVTQPDQRQAKDPEPTPAQRDHLAPVRVIISFNEDGSYELTAYAHPDARIRSRAAATRAAAAQRPILYTARFTPMESANADHEQDAGQQLPARDR